MPERIINELKAKKAVLIGKIQNLAQKSVSETLTDNDVTEYENLKKEVVDIENKIIDMQKYAVDNEENFEPVGTKQNSFVNFLKTGDTSGLNSTKNIKNISRTDVAVVVPKETEAAILKKQEQESILMQIATVEDFASSEKDIPVEGNDTTAYWVDEGVAFTESDPTIESKVLKAHKEGALTKATTELLEDAVVDMEAYIVEKQGKALAKLFETDALTNATNNGKKPYGLLSQAQVGVTAASSTAFTAKEITKLFTSVKQGYRKNGVWLVSTDALTQLIDLEDTNGNRIYVPSYVPGIPDTLLGRPVYEHELMPNVAAGTTPIAFGDFKYFRIGRRKGLTMQRLGELFATEGKVGFLSQQRIDSVLTIPEAIKTLKMKAGV